MTIVADENIDRQIVDGLRSAGHDVLYVAELDPGIDDDAVLRYTGARDAILLTSDKDFGELVFRRHLLHTGIVLLRLQGLPPEQKSAAVVAMFHARGAELPARFAVLTNRTLRIRT